MKDRLFRRMDNNALVTRAEFVAYLRDCSRRWLGESVSKEGGFACQEQSMRVRDMADQIEADGRNIASGKE